MNSTAPKRNYIGHYTKSGNLMVSEPGYKKFRVEADQIEMYLAYLTRLGHTFTLISKK